MRRQHLLTIALACGLAVGLLGPLTARAQEDEPIGNEYRLTVFPHHRINDHASGFGYLGYVTNPEKEYQVGYLGWGANCNVNRYIQPWAGLITTYTDNEHSADKLELRPFGGSKFFLPNEAKWIVYNFTRYEFRDIQDLDTHEWTGIHRLRSRFGLEIPLASREKAWQPKTWYAMVDAEPIYRFDKNMVDPFRVRGGIGHIVSSRVRVEFIYHAQFTRPAGSSGLEYTDNIFRLNIKIALNKGVLQRVFDGGDADD